MESVFCWHWAVCPHMGREMQQKLIKESDSSYTLQTRRQAAPAEVEVLLELEAIERTAQEEESASHDH